MAFKNDMTWMYTVHAALRRELERIARITARADDDPMRTLRTAAGWEMFKSYLHVHHTAEDDMLWPPMRSALAEDSAGTALLDAMESEHAAIDPLLDAIDTALLDRESGPQRLGELTGNLATALRRHLDHEEAECLALIDATLTADQLAAFGAEHGKRLGADVRRYLPWALDGAAPEVTAKLLGQLPAPVQQVYRDEWQPAYAELAPWAPPVRERTA